MLYFHYSDICLPVAIIDIVLSCLFCLIFMDELAELSLHISSHPWCEDWVGHYDN
jgi:hypothetical protein